jgi:hypothetical protein
VAIDGRAPRRSHYRKTDQKALHLVPACATETQLVIGQEAVFQKSNEITAVPALIERLDLKGRRVYPRRQGRLPVDSEGQPADLRGTSGVILIPRGPRRLKSSRRSARATASWRSASTVSHVVGRYGSILAPPRFPKLTTIGMVESCIEACLIRQLFAPQERPHALCLPVWPRARLV